MAGGPLVEAPGQPVGDPTVGAEAGHHVGGVEGGEGSEGAQPEADEHVDEVGPVEHRDGQRGQVGRRSPGLDHPGGTGDRRPGGR